MKKIAAIVGLILLSTAAHGAQVDKVNKSKRTVRLTIEDNELPSAKKGDAVVLSTGKKKFVGVIRQINGSRLVIQFSESTKALPSEGAVGALLEKESNASGSGEGVATLPLSERLEKTERTERVAELKESFIFPASERFSNALPAANTPWYNMVGYRLLFPNSAQIYRVKKVAAAVSLNHGATLINKDGEIRDQSTATRDEGYRIVGVFTLPGFPLRLGVDYSKALTYVASTVDERNRFTGNRLTIDVTQFTETTRRRLLLGFPIYKNFFGGLGIESGVSRDKGFAGTGAVDFSGVDAGILWSGDRLEAGVSYYPYINEADGGPDEGGTSYTQVGQTILHASFYLSDALSSETVLTYNRWSEDGRGNVRDKMEYGLGAGLQSKRGRGTIMVDYNPNFLIEGASSWVGLVVDGKFNIGSRLGLGSTIEVRNFKIEEVANEFKYKNPYAYSLSARVEYFL